MIPAVVSTIKAQNLNGNGLSRITYSNKERNIEKEYENFQRVGEMPHRFNYQNFQKETELSSKYMFGLH
jgi:hypothetical protein